MLKFKVLKLAILKIADLANLYLMQTKNGIPGGGSPEILTNEKTKNIGLVRVTALHRGAKKRV